MRSGLGERREGEREGGREGGRGTFERDIEKLGGWDGGIIKKASKYVGEISGPFDKVPLIRLT